VGVTKNIARYTTDIRDGEETRMMEMFNGHKFSKLALKILHGRGGTVEEGCSKRGCGSEGVTIPKREMVNRQKDLLRPGRKIGERVNRGRARKKGGKGSMVEVKADVFENSVNKLGVRSAERIVGVIGSLNNARERRGTVFGVENSHVD